MAKKSKSRSQKPAKPTPRFVEWWRSIRGRRLRGSVYILFALFMAISIVSFFFTGMGQSPETYGSNWLGSVGGAVAVFFVKRFFGFFSIGLAFLLFVYGFKLWGKAILPWNKALWSTLFWIFWASTFFGYIAERWVENPNFDNIAGIGVVFAAVLYPLLKWGVFVLLLFVAVVFLIFVHRIRFSMPDVNLPDLKSILPKRQPKEVADIADPITPNNAAKTPVNQPLVQDLTDHDDDDESLRTPDDDQQTVPFDIDDEFTRLVERVQQKDASDQGEPRADVEFDITDPDMVDMHDDSSPKNSPAFDVELEIVESSNVADDIVPSDDEELQMDDSDSRVHFGIDQLYDPHLDLKDYQMPTTDMLEDWEQRNVKVSREELVENKDRIVATLRDYGIEIESISASPGPTVTLYEIKPARGVRISKIKTLEDDIALSLAALGIRIIAPIPGKGTVGIEVPNATPHVVAMKTMLESPAFRDSKMELPIAIGKTINNDPFVTDLAKMPHLLMAGATGTGKSVGLNAVIASLLFKKHPSELKFVMVDPKKVELSLYSTIERHYLAKMPDTDEAIITDVKKVVRTLNSLCLEMDQRYDLLRAAQVRKITEYNAKFINRRLNPENGHRFLPYIVLVIDEFADLIMTAGKEIESPICRLAQLARAVGIHLIIATQRPTTNIITGTIKANFPARIAFKVASAIDSRTILDTTGAQRLIGRGDMLISLSGSDLVRLQCALIETEEIDRVGKFICDQRGYPEGFLLPEYLDENEEPNKEFDPKHKDEFFNDAARLVVANQFGSTSLLQRKLKLGYNRAGRIIDQLEAAGIVGPYAGSKPREVLVKTEIELEEILRSL